MTERKTLKLPTPPETFAVWRTTTGRMRKQHRTEKAAMAEAKRLAEKHPGQDFLVMKALRLVRRRVAV